MMSHYILTADGEPVPCDDVLMWGRWFQTADRKLCVTTIADDVQVSTVFLGLDHSFSANGPPILWETLVFGGALDGEMSRDATRQEALRGHEAMVARVRV